jgi:hypothetical protein
MTVGEHDALQEPSVRCTEPAIGGIIRADGYRCELCERHQSQDWAAMSPQDGGDTLYRLPIVDRDPRRICQRMVPRMEVIKL